MLKNVLLQFIDLYKLMYVYCRKEDKLYASKQLTVIFKKKKIKTLLLYLNTYDLTSDGHVTQSRLHVLLLQS